MNIGDSFGDRMLLARKAAQLSLRRLADCLGTSYECLRQYEEGDRIPPSDKLIAIARGLNVPVEFFFPPPVPVGTITPLCYYAMPEAAKRRDAILAQVREWLERYRAIEEITGDRASFQYPEGFPTCVETVSDAQETASEIAAKWGLTHGIDLIRTLEDKGIRIGEIKGTEDWGAGAFLCEDQPVIAIARTTKGEQRRTKVAKSLGQILMRPKREDPIYYDAFTEQLMEHMTEQPSRMKTMVLRAYKQGLITESRARGLLGR